MLYITDICIFIVLFQLGTSKPTYKQEFVVAYNGPVALDSVKDEYKAEIEKKLPSVQTTLQDMCTLNFGPEANVPDVVLSETVKFNVTGSKVCIAVVASTTLELKTDVVLD